MKSLFKNLFVGIITTVFGFGLGFWFNNVYNQPLIEWYSRPYYKMNDFAVGNIFLINTGRTSDHNIALTLDSEIKDNTIKIVDLTSEYSIKHNDNKTLILIDELKPGEQADITFKDDSSKDDIYFDLISNSSRIKPMYKNDWWHFSGIVTIVFSTLLILFGFIFCMITKWLIILKNKKITDAQDVPF